MNGEQFERLDRAVTRIVNAHNRQVTGPVPNQAPIRPWQQEVWASGEPGEVIDLDELGAEMPGHWSSRAMTVAVDCGTACCLAGDVVIEAGATLLINENDFDVHDTDPIDVEQCLLDGRVRDIDDTANDLLGLPSGHNLFGGYNTAEMIVNLATRYAADAGFTLTAKAEDVLPGSATEPEEMS